MSRYFRLLPALVLGLPLLSAAQAAPTKSGTLEVDARLGHRVLREGTKQRVYLRIGLRGIHDPGAESRRAPVNIALVIDKSGSMRGHKIQKAREAAIMAVERLTRGDVASVVTFSSGVDVAVPAARVKDHDHMRRLIRSIRAGGSTAIYAAVRAGADELKEYGDDERLDRIILLSDGLANVGPSDPYTFEELGRRLGGRGVSVTTIGLGRGYNEDLMSRLAAASDGNHDFARTADDLRRIFNREFDDVLSVIAQEIEIIIETRSGVRPLRSLGRHAEISGNRAKLKVAQVYGTSTHSLQLELEVDSDIADGEREIADITVRFRPHGKQGRTVKSARVRASFSSDEDVVTKSMDPIVMDPVVELIAREKSRKAIELRDQGKAKEARVLLQQSSKIISTQNKLRQRYNHKSSSRLQKLERQYEKDADGVLSRDWNVQRKVMRKGLGNAAGSSVKY